MKRDQDYPIAAAFIDERDTLLTGTQNGKLQLWNLDINEAIRFICGVGGTPITQAEWSQYIPDIPYTPPCT
ncbi:hypothetical protein ACSDR0_43025 [Streptosporangium sp. G11]|uniref:hypothetical protein n=1 Tax=Streptosporangium sp. G11 TaxID=3436926 RepID=UPI003EBF4A43